MNHTLGGSFGSRINMNLREAHGYTYGAWSGFKNIEPEATSLRRRSSVPM